MLYQLEYHSNPNCLSIHVDKKLTDKMIEHFMSADWHKDKQPAIVRDIFNSVEGVEQVSLHRYEIGITKGVVFEWKDMIDKIIFNLQLAFAPQEEMKEKVAPIKSYIDENGFGRYISQNTDEGLHSFKLFEEDEEL
jgi:hypothetical protein